MAAAAAQDHQGQQAGGEHRPGPRLGHGGGHRQAGRAGVQADDLAVQDVADHPLGGFAFQGERMVVAVVVAVAVAGAPCAMPELGILTDR